MSDEKYKWEFRSRFRRNAYGWKSQPAIKRIREAVSEIRRVAKKEPTLAAEGAVLFLERVAPSLEHVDSSSGAIGSAVDRAIDGLIPIIVRADVVVDIRQKWLERLWQAIQDDDMPYIEHLGDRFGELCVHPQLASRWADALMEPTKRALLGDRLSTVFFKGTSVCLGAMLAAGRYEELVALIRQARSTTLLHYRQFGIRALAILGHVDEAIGELESADRNMYPSSMIAMIGEEILLSAGQTERAFLAYGYEANPKSTFLASYRALRKKYPTIDAREMLMHCIAQTPGEEGKWFAAARHAGFLELAQDIATKYTTEPKTLISAAKDHAGKDPDFAINIGLIAIRNLNAGIGYDEPTAGDIIAAYRAVMQAAETSGKQVEVIKALHRWLHEREKKGLAWTVLGEAFSGGG